MNELLERFAGLDRRWKLGLGVGLVVLLMVQCASGGGGSDSDLPAGIREGAHLYGFQLQGEQPVYLDQGMEIIAVQDPWVRIRLHDDPASDRWLNFNWVSGYHPKVD